MIGSNKQGNWLEQQAARNPDNVAMISGTVQLSYIEVYQKALSIAGRLAEHGIRENDHAAIILNNSAEYVLLIYAAWLKGCVPVVINPRLTRQNIKELIKHSNSKLVITDNPNRSFENNVSIVNVYDLTDTGDGEITKDTSHTDNSVLIYTSGTSGKPKGVPVKFSSLFNSVSAIDAIDKYSERDSFLLSLPLYHIGGFSIMVRSLLAGSKLIIPQNLNLSNLHSKLMEHKPAIISLVPTMLKALTDEEAQLPESIRLIYVGGGPSDDSVIHKALELKYPIVKVYGSTETCAMTTYADAELLSSSPSSSGKAIGNSKIKILNDNGEELKPGQSGEIVIQSDSLFDGYYGNEYETAGRLINEKYFTGDIGFKDSEGNLFVESRREDLIVTGGENVSPVEIMNTLNRHPVVSESAVFAVQDQHWGQMVCAAIVTRSGRHVSAEELSLFLRKEIPSFKIPKKYYFTDSLPRNEIGKVNIGELKRILNLNF